jgi:hypothetical protein
MTPHLTRIQKKETPFFSFGTTEITFLCETGKKNLSNYENENSVGKTYNSKISLKYFGKQSQVLSVAAHDGVLETIKLLLFVVRRFPAFGLWSPV